ncbi:MAG TPA: hypothetical protein VIY47_04090 [Ignavibacteriaceae bacterium]
MVSSIKQNMQHGSTGTLKREGRCGKKWITSKQDDRALVRHSKSNCEMTSRRLMVEMHASGVHLSSKTVRRRLIDAGLRAYRPRKKPKVMAAFMKRCSHGPSNSRHG